MKHRADPITSPIMQAGEASAAITPTATDNFSIAEYRMKIPEGVKVPKAIFCLLSGFNSDGRRMIDNAELAAFAEAEELAMVAVYHKAALPPAEIRKNLDKHYTHVVGGSGKAFWTALERMAGDLNRPELAKLPVVFLGHSAGGQFGYGMACEYPARTIGFVSVKGGFYHTQPKEETLRSVPGLFIAGAKDEAFRMEHIRKAFGDARRQGALWSMAVEPEAGHGLDEATMLALPYIRGILAKRLSCGGTLRALEEKEGFWADLEAGKARPAEDFGGDAIAAAWLPDAGAAGAWEKLVGGEWAQLAKLRLAVNRNAPAVMDTLRQWVGINSFTFNTDGVNQLGKATAEAFAPLGFDPELVPSKEPEAGHHLVLVKPGEAGSKSVLFISHLDTVYPPEEQSRLKFAWREDGDRIYGPGVGDIKGGTAMILLMMKAMAEAEPEKYRRSAFHVFFNATEEGFHHHFSKTVIERLPGNAVACLVMEPVDVVPSPGRMKLRLANARKGGFRFKIEVLGKGGHAGNAHENGVNAIRQAARIVEKLESMTDYESGLAFNIGSISGGETPNRIPELARIYGEARATRQADLDKAVAILESLEEEENLLKSSRGDFSAKVKVEIVPGAPPFEINPSTESLVKVWGQCAGMMRAEVDPVSRGGISDGNFVWQRLPTIDGLGTPGGNIHCAEHNPEEGKEAEFIYRPEFEPKALLNLLGVLALLA